MGGLEDQIRRSGLTGDLVDRLLAAPALVECFERAVAERCGMLNSVLDSLADGVAVAEADGRLLYFNKAAESLLGKGATGTGPSTWTEAYGVYRPDQLTPFPDSEYPLALALKGQSTNGVEMFVRNRGMPEGRYISASGRPLRSESGEIRGAVVVFRDVTELQRAHAQLRVLNGTLEARVTERTEALRQAEAHLRHAQKMEAVGRLAGGIAHDFNNLLVAIMGYSDLLFQRMTPDDPARADVQEIRQAGDRASSLTRQLLLITRKRPPRTAAVSLNEVVGGMEKLLRRLLGAKIELRSSLDAAAGFVTADVTHVEQVLLNLAVNARDAMPDGGRLTFSTGRVELLAPVPDSLAGVEPGRYGEIRVSDDGVGMTEEVRTRIFEPYFTTKPEGSGTGLGLFIVYGIVRQSGGAILVESAVGKGTTFRVLLPAASDESSSAREQAGSLDRLRGTETVLVADDDVAVRNLVATVLQLQGYAVLQAANGREAWRIAQDRSRNIHLLLTDCVMPELDGDELTRRVLSVRPGLPVIRMSGYEEAEAKAPGILILPKPFTPSLLARTVRIALDGQAHAS